MKNLNFNISNRNKKFLYFIIISVLILLLTSLILFFTFKQAPPEKVSQLIEVKEVVPRQAGSPAYCVLLNPLNGTSNYQGTTSIYCTKDTNNQR